MYLNMVIVFKIIKKECSSCKKNYKLVDFRKGDKLLKTCLKCRDSVKKAENKSKCVHDRRKSICKDCGGDGICIHNRQKYQCLDCGGSSFCQHNIYKYRCIDCGGSSICIHNKRKDNCKLCSDPIDITIKQMINHSKQKDKKYNRYDETNFVDYLFLKNLIDNSNNKCYYCQCDLQYIHYNHTLGTIERINNTLGHIKSNCVICCRTCNYTRVGSRINPQ